MTGRGATQPIADTKDHSRTTFVNGGALHMVPHTTHSAAAGSSANAIKEHSVRHHVPHLGNSNTGSTSTSTNKGAYEPLPTGDGTGKPLDGGDGCKGPGGYLEDDTPSYAAITFESIFSVVWQRTSVLISLLLLQSLSQFILEMYETLISKHVIIPLFLTMLVGAGGNAGNQATVRAITGLVTDEFRMGDFWLVLRKELCVGLINASLLAGIGFGRVYYFYGTSGNMFWSTVSITLSLFSIVLTSVILGCILPFLLGALGQNKEHAAPIIQVLMDIIGVFITCSICSKMIPASEGTKPSAPSATKG